MVESSASPTDPDGTTTAAGPAAEQSMEAARPVAVLRVATALNGYLLPAQQTGAEACADLAERLGLPAPADDTRGTSFRVASTLQAVDPQRPLADQVPQDGALLVEASERPAPPPQPDESAPEAPRSSATRSVGTASEDWLTRQYAAARAIAAANSFLSIYTCGQLPRGYIVELRCHGLVHGLTGQVHRAFRHLVRFDLPASEHQEAPADVEWLTHLAHPNILPGRNTTGFVWGRDGGVAELLDYLLEQVQLVRFDLGRDVVADATVARLIIDGQVRIPLGRKILARSAPERPTSRQLADDA